MEIIGGITVKRNKDDVYAVEGGKVLYAILDTRITSYNVCYTKLLRLAWEAFNRIANGDVENLNKGAIDRPIFFQFLSASEGVILQDEDTPIDQRGKLAVILSSYDINGLEKFFLETQSWA